MARKGKYEYWLTADGQLLIEGMARDGLTDEQMARKMGISVSTFYEWNNRFSEFSEALKKGRAPIDYEVENKLLELCRSGDKTAIIFWLKNRRPDLWKDRRDKDENTDKSIVIKLDDSLIDFAK